MKSFFNETLNFLFRIFWAFYLYIDIGIDTYLSVMPVYLDKVKKAKLQAALTNPKHKLVSLASKIYMKI